MPAVELSTFKFVIGHLIIRLGMAMINHDCNISNRKVSDLKYICYIYIVFAN